MGVLFMSAPFSAIAAARLSRRGFMAGLAGLLGSSALSGCAGMAGGGGSPSTLTFAEIPQRYETGHRLPEGYAAQVLIRWGDPLFADAPPFSPLAQTAEAQTRQFGFNNDFTAFLPLPYGSASSTRGLLCVNHEYILTRLMFPDTVPSREKARIEMAAHGHSVLEVRRGGDGWEVVTESPYTRRFNGLTTVFGVGGPAAGHRRLQTSADPAGRAVTGTYGNCAGGVTPWGTVLVAEENFNEYFFGDAARHPEAEALRRYDISGRPYTPWHRYDPRFDLNREPNEPNRHGWVVEYDPYDPSAPPVKRTALGRFKHENATAALTADGRVAVYSGDDEMFQCLYRFVSRRRYDPADRAANRGLLDDGTLYAARFDEGGVSWLPLVFGAGPLTPANGFHDQGDVLIEVRRAAALVGATPMDRPEDVEVHPTSGAVYVSLSNNKNRTAPDAANPRPANVHGHVIELLPPLSGQARDHGADRYAWDFFLLGGNPDVSAHHARYHRGVSHRGWLSCPDNLAFDPGGRIWIATDGMPKSGVADALYAADCAGPGRALTRRFFAVPRGAEVTGPSFTPDGTTLFVSVQHPGDEEGSTFLNPSTRWPDFRDDTPPRPAVVAIRRRDGGVIGS